MRTTTSIPPVAQLLPHAGRMVLLSTVEQYEPDSIACSATVAPDNPYLDDELRVASWYSLEFMAQALAAHAGLESLEQGVAPRVGFLVGCRRLELSGESYPVGQELLVKARRLWKEGEMAVCECELLDRRSGRVLAKGNLNVFMPENEARLIKMREA